MGKVKIVYLDKAIEDITNISFFIESKGLEQTAKRYAKSIYDFIDKLNYEQVYYLVCREKLRRALGLKCVMFKKKYTVVFYQFDDTIIVTQFVLSKLIDVVSPS